MSEAIRKLYTSRGLGPPDGKGIHTYKFHSCVAQVMEKGGKVNPYAVCMARLGPAQAVKSSHRRTKTQRYKGAVQRSSCGGCPKREGCPHRK